MPVAIKKCALIKSALLPSLILACGASCVDFPWSQSLARTIALSVFNVVSCLTDFVSFELKIFCNHFFFLVSLGFIYFRSLLSYCDVIVIEGAWKYPSIYEHTMLSSEQSRWMSLRVQLYMSPRPLLEGWKRPIMLLQFINWISPSLHWCPLISLAEKRRGSIRQSWAFLFSFRSIRRSYDAGGWKYDHQRQKTTGWGLW